MKKKLPKYVINKMTPVEKNKLERLTFKNKQIWDKMAEVQAEATVASRIEDDERPGMPYSDSVQRKINRGFKYEKLAFDALDKLHAFEDEMRKKY
jgi:hypothetical protein